MWRYLKKILGFDIFGKNIELEFFRIAIHGDVDSLKDFLQKNPKLNLNLYDNDGMSVLHMEHILADVAKIKLLKDKGMNLNIRDKIAGLTPLHYAVISGNLDAMQELIEFGADIDVVCNNADTALHYACDLNKEEAVNILLDSGANTSLRNKDNKTAKEIARDKNNKDIISLLDNKCLLAFAMAKHPRLGEKSNANALDDDMFKIIASFSRSR
ncbi:MAG: ankyrin repeat domain-containing protein [Rickettsiales bacterium]|nr:ankyrin repeat domain-containing protein [Rickettsiales bacterium]